MNHSYRLFLAIVFLLLIYTSGFSQEKRFITFYATTSGPVGHAFVSFAREDNSRQQTVLDGVWGLYPVSRANGVKSLVVGEVPGEIRDDFLARKDVGLTVAVTEQEYQSALNIKERWKNSPYELTERDCLSFVIEVARSLSAKIVVPDRSLLDKPYDYINALKLLNVGGPSNPRSLIPSQLCDYQALLDQAADPKECDLLNDLYTKLLGIASNLGNYRRMYLQNGDLIDVFPTVYYHMTVIEMDKLRQGKVDYAVDKMRQMIYFFDAYEYNRKQPQQNREEHWRRHFQEVADAGSYDFCQSFRKVMTSAIRAHVRFDLTRAIRHAYDFSSSVSPVGDLRVEFEATNGIFALAQADALKDISKVTACGMLGDLNFRIFGGITIGEIKDWRMAAFDNALVSRGPLLGYGGNLAAQPSYHPHQIYRNIGEVTRKGQSPTCKSFNSTLFLFDLSGSMNDHGGGAIPKVEQAKNASKETLAALKSNGQGITNQVAAYGFAGSCVPDPTIEISPFDTDLDAVEQKIFQMRAGGGTPLGNAIRAAECKMAAHLQRQGQQKGRLIILSDGQGTCGSIRPNGVYNSAPLQRNRSIIVDASHCGGGVSPNASQVSYYTVGFNISPGSPAERDLQYLSQISGGKYLNVQNQVQLARAFRKFNRVYQPKAYPALSDLPTKSTTLFSDGVEEIKEEYYEKALEQYTLFVQDHPGDCHGVYNLAIAQEANDYLKEAIDSYRKYLSLCPSVNDRTFVEKQIKFLEEEFREFVQFQRAVVKSDLDFLKIHFERIQHGQSVALAEEFKGFLQEKGNYYEELPRLIANSDRFLMDITEEIASSFKQCKSLIRRSPDSWDRDAVPLISMSYLHLQDLLEEM